MMEKPIAGLALLTSFLITPVLAEESIWFAATIDNDIFIGQDNGYTNGIYFSWFELVQKPQQTKPNWLVKPLLWSVDLADSNATLETYSLGQVMVTPQDITIEDPPRNDIPYSGSLLFNYSLISMKASTADSIGTVVGIVGPSSGAEETQKWVHELVGADEPRGWDTQLQDEVVFQFYRSRLWKSWSNQNDTMDLLVLASAGLGTISSFTAAAALFRFGSELSNTFATPLLISTRAANPAAIGGGWYAYAGLRVETIFNTIYADGNTFQDSRSIDYDRTQVGLTAGLAYSWKNTSVTFALFDSNAADESVSDYSQFGTLTVGWRF